MAKDVDGLTPFQEAFVAQYLIHGDAAKAAIAAGSNARNRRIAAVVGYDLLQLPQIQREIEKRRSRKRKKLDLTADRVLLEYKRIALANIRDVMDWHEELVYLPDGTAYTESTYRYCPDCGQPYLHAYSAIGAVRCLSCGWSAEIAPEMPETAQEGAKTETRPILRLERVLHLKPSGILSDDISAAIAEISETPNGIKIKMHDKTKALDALGKHLDLFRDPLADAVTGLAERMARAESRVSGGDSRENSDAVKGEPDEAEHGE